MPNNNNKISVLLAVFNGELYLKDAIESVFQQTYQNWELIIVDNGSTDDTDQVGLEWAGKDDRIKFFKLTKKGKTNAYNFAFQKSSGEFICFFAADDKLEFDSLEKRLLPLSADPKYNSSTCLLRTFSEDSIHDGVIFPKNKELPNFSGGSIFFIRSLAEKIFPIPIDLPNEDTWTSLHLRAFGLNCHVSLVAYNYRIHPNNSYGYGLSFAEKRSKFLQRMEAYTVFYSRYSSQRIKFVDEYVKYFVKALNCAKQNKVLSILTVKIPIRERLIFVFYTVPIFYKIRYKYFKFFSGIFN